MGEQSVLVNDLIANSPRVDEAHVDEIENREEIARIAAEEEEKAQSEPEQSGRVASGGSSPSVPVPSIPNPLFTPPIKETGNDTFNPAIHATDPNTGQPKRNNDGSFAKKRGRKPGSTNSGNTSGNVPESGASSGPARVPVDYRGLATLFSSVTFNFCSVAISPAWEPKSEEREQIDNALARFMQAHDISDIPPGIALVIVVGQYALARAVSDPITQYKLKKLGSMVGIVKPPAPLEIKQPPAPIPTAPVAPPQPMVPPPMQATQGPVKSTSTGVRPKGFNPFAQFAKV